MIQLVELTSLLQRAVKSMQLYGPSTHPRTREAIDHLISHTDKFLLVTPRLQIVVSQNRIFLNGQLIRQQSPSVKWFIDQLMERRLNGFVMANGITPAEIEQVVKILVLKPLSLQDAGGAAQLLAEIGSSHVRLSFVRYEEVREGEIVVPEETLVGDGSGAGNPAGGLLGIGSGAVGFGTGLLGAGVGGGAASGGTFTDATGSGLGFGEGGGFPDMPFGEMREDEAINHLSHLTRAWFGGQERRGPFDTGDSGTAGGSGSGAGAGSGTGAGSGARVGAGNGARTGDGPGSGEGVGSGIGSGGPGAGRGDSLRRAIRFQTFAANVAAWLREQSVDLMRLRARLKDMGVSKDELESLLHAIAWEKLGTDDRLAKALEQNLIHELPQDQILGFILELIRGGRISDASRLIEKLGAGLFADSHETRRSTIDAFARIATWEADPGLPPEIEAMVDKFLLTHFVRESDPQIHERSLLAFENLYDSWIARDQLAKAYQILRKLEGAAAAASTQAPWKSAALGVLLGRLTSDERMKLLLSKMYARDVESSATLFHPLLTLFAEKAAARLLDALAEEEDRGRRGRLMKAVKAVGKPALNSLREATKSQTWYLIRNALNLIGDLVAVDLLDDAIEALAHRDDRVRRAAARALGKLGGLRAEKLLGDALASNEAETQMEILSALGTMKGDSAIPQIAELTKKRMGRGDDPVRIRAIETMGQTGSASAVPALIELIRKKGLLGGGESNEARLAAAKALVTLVTSGVQEARAAIEVVAAAEPEGPVRQQLQRSGNGKA